MAQHDQVIDNGSGLTVRTDFNAAIAALFSNSSGPVEPGTTVAGQFWWDTANAANPVLRQRNLANTGWMTISQGGQSAIDIATGKRPGPPKDTFVWNDKLDLSGTDVMTLDDTGNLSVIGNFAMAGTTLGAPNAVLTAKGATFTGDVDLQGHQLKNAVIPQPETRNRIVNPAMWISQENGSVQGAMGNYYPADQWNAIAAGVSGTTIRAFVAGEPLNISYTLAAKPTLAAADYTFFQQKIEGLNVTDFFWGTPQAKPVVLRFEVKCTVAGTYAAAIQNGANDRSFLAAFSVAANTWTPVVIAVPADTAGTWVLNDTSAAMALYLSCALGSNYVGTLGWQAGNKLAPPGMTNGAAGGCTFSIRNVGLYRDPLNSGAAPPFETPNYADELLRCQRYWEMVQTENNINVSDLNSYSFAYKLVTKRVNPTVAMQQLSQVGNVSGYPQAGNSSALYAAVKLALGSPNTMAYAQTYLKANARM